MRRYRIALPPPLGMLLVAGLACMLLVGCLTGSVALSRHLLGLDAGQPSAQLRALTVHLSLDGDNFTPRVAAISSGGRVTFVNDQASPIVVRSDALSPRRFSLAIVAHGRAALRLARPGLYHYYDARTARPWHALASSTVLTTTVPAGGEPRQGWIAVVGAVRLGREHLRVPPGQDLFTPRVLVAAVGSTIVIANHDSDAHNVVLDPASPAGAAFVVNGTDAEPPSGWQRSLVVQQPGIYHLYCTMHTRVVGIRDGWRAVVPRPDASGYRDHEPMEAWIIVLPVSAAT